MYIYIYVCVNKEKKTGKRRGWMIGTGKWQKRTKGRTRGVDEKRVYRGYSR
jgi:hypothetical protein